MSYPFGCVLKPDSAWVERFPAWTSGKRFDATGKPVSPATWKSGKRAEPTFWRATQLHLPELTPKALAAAVASVAADPRALFVQGLTRKPRVRANGATFGNREVQVLVLDVENETPPLGVDPTSAAAIEWFIKTRLPPEFHAAGYAWHFSSSAGRKGQELRAHLLFPLVRPELLRGTLRIWVQHARVADPCTTLPTQKVYFADPVFDSPDMDPFAGRSRVGYRDGPPVDFDFGAVDEPILYSPTGGGKRHSGPLPQTIEESLAWASSGVSVHRAGLAFGRAWASHHGGLGDLSEAATRLREALLEGRKRLGHKGRPLAEIETEIGGLKGNIKGAITKGYHLSVLVGVRSRELWVRLEVGDQSAALTLAHRFPGREVEILRRLPAAARGPVKAALERHAGFYDRVEVSVSGFTGTRLGAPQELPIAAGCGVGLRAPLGSGKTLAAFALCKERGLRVAHVSPRVSLTKDAAARGTLTGYVEINQLGGGSHNGNGCALCAPSVGHEALAEAIADCDVLIIDEASLVADLLSAGILRARRLEVFTGLQTAVEGKAVALLDADLTDSVVSWWAALLGRRIDRFVVPEREGVGTARFVRQKDIHKAILDSRAPAWIASDSRRELAALALELRRLGRRDFLLLTSDTRHRPRVKG